MSDHDKLYCSFCGKREDEGVKLIAGPTVLICDECVDLCSIMVHTARQSATEPLLAVEDVPPAKLPEFVARLKLALQEQQKASADYLQVLRAVEFEAEAYFDALLDIAFPDRSGLSDLDGNPMNWSATRAYTALGGRIENGQRLDSYEELKGDE